MMTRNCKITGPATALATLLLSFWCIAASAGGPICGDARLGPNETCDDGNAVSGDGCSSACIVEANFECSVPFQPLTNNTVIDGGFELGQPSNVWDSVTSTNDSVLCSLDFCPNEGMSRLGAWWARFGSQNGRDDSRLFQEVLIGTAARELQFDLQHFACDSLADTLLVLVDGQEVFGATGGDPGCFDPAYQRQTVDLVSAPGGPYNDGGLHSFEIISSTSFNFNGPSIFAIDNIVIGDALGAPFPSTCWLDDRTIYVEDFDPPTGGDLGSLGFTTFELGDPVPWGTTDDGICGSRDIPPGNFTGGAGEAACLDANASDGAQIFSFLCTEPLNFFGLLMTELSFLLNVQFDGFSALDFFSVLVGVDPPDPGSIAGYLLLFQTFENIGTIAEPVGSLINLDLSQFDGKPQVFICFAFSSTMAFYAQVDETSVSFGDCVDDLDKDKLESCTDNCTDTANPDQTDSDGDGYGNACDADISRAGATRVAPGNGNDCFVNVLDLGALKEAFFSRPGDAHWNPDADFTADLLVNIEDLGRMKQLFFKTPGPSGATSVCGTP